MSRIIVDRYDDGKVHVVVGWDHPNGGCYWQEWATQQEIDDAAKVLANLDIKGDLTDDEEHAYTVCEEIVEGCKRYGGYMRPSIPLADLRVKMPPELQHFVTDEVMALLFDHAADPDSGFGKSDIDLTRDISKVNDDGSPNWH